MKTWSMERESKAVLLIWAGVMRKIAVFIIFCNFSESSANPYME